MFDGDFYFDGISSSTYGLYDISLDTGLISEPYFGSQSLIKDKTYKKNKSILYGVINNYQ